MSVLMMPTASDLPVSVRVMPTDHPVFLPNSAENQVNYEEIGRICCLRIRPITLSQTAPQKKDYGHNMKGEAS